MNVVAPELDPDEWAEVALAFADDGTTRSAAQSARAGWGGRLAALIPGRTPVDTGDLRQQAVRRFLLAARQRRPIEECAASLLSAGFNRRQVEALALLAAPPRGCRCNR